MMGNDITTRIDVDEWRTMTQSLAEQVEDLSRQNAKLVKEYDRLARLVRAIARVMPDCSSDGYPRISLPSGGKLQLMGDLGKQLRKVKLYKWPREYR